MLASFKFQLQPAEQTVYFAPPEIAAANDASKMAGRPSEQSARRLFVSSSAALVFDSFNCK